MEIFVVKNITENKTITTFLARVHLDLSGDNAIGIGGDCLRLKMKGVVPTTNQTFVAHHPHCNCSTSLASLLDHLATQLAILLSSPFLNEKHGKLKRSLCASHVLRPRPHSLSFQIPSPINPNQPPSIGYRLKFGEIWQYQLATFIRRFINVVLIIAVVHGRVCNVSMIPSAPTASSVRAPEVSNQVNRKIVGEKPFMISLQYTCIHQLQRAQLIPNSFSVEQRLPQDPDPRVLLDSDEFDIVDAPVILAQPHLELEGKPDEQDDGDVQPSTRTTSPPPIVMSSEASGSFLMDFVMAASRLLSLAPELIGMFCLAHWPMALSLPVFWGITRTPVPLTSWYYSSRRLFMLYHRYLSPFVVLQFYLGSIRAENVSTTPFDHWIYAPLEDMYVFYALCCLLVIIGYQLNRIPPLFIYDVEKDATGSTC